MTEYVITEDEYRAAMRTAYEAGAAGREVYSARNYLTRPLVRCRDCRFYLDGKSGYCDCFTVADWVPDGFCAWAERREFGCR